MITDTDNTPTNPPTNGTLKAANGSATSIVEGYEKKTRFTNLASGLVDVQADERIVDSFSGLHTAESLSKLYDNFSKDYESAYAEVEYEGPQNVAKELKAALPDADGSKIRVLDAGCGSGLVGAACAAQGFTNLVGIDLSTGMMELAKKKEGLYSEFKVADLTKPVPFEDNQFDAVVSCGVFTAGHVGKEPIRELVRVVRPGGVLVIACQEHVYIREEFPAFLQGLKKEGLILDVTLTTAYSMRKTKTEMTILKVPVC